MHAVSLTGSPNWPDPVEPPQPVPVPGMMVWYEPSTIEPVIFALPPLGHPCAAVIVAVWSPNLVNLAVFDASGYLHQRASVYMKTRNGPTEYYGQPHARWPASVV